MPTNRRVLDAEGPSLPASSGDRSLMLRSELIDHTEVDHTDADHTEVNSSITQTGLGLLSVSSALL